MNIHKNARLTPHSRAEAARRVLDGGQTAKAVATAFAVSERTVRNWVKRSQAEGPAGLLDRSSRPHRLRQPTPETVVQRIAELRRERMPGKAISAEVGKVAGVTAVRVDLDGKAVAVRGIGIDDASVRAAIAEAGGVSRAGRALRSLGAVGRARDDDEHAERDEREEQAPMRAPRGATAEGCREHRGGHALQGVVDDRGVEPLTS